MTVVENQKQRLGTKRGFISVKSNCSIQSYVPALHPLMKFGITKVLACTYQAISGAGKNFERWPEMVDNLIPYIGGEEEKMESETLYLLGSLDGDEVKPADFPVSASCHRVAVVDGHTEAVFLELDEDVDIEKVKKVMSEFKGLPQELGLYSAPEHPVIVREEDDRPQPRMDRNASGGMAATVGRLRKDVAMENSLKYVLVGHNTIRGAAGASILNAELINKQIL
jgi:aspartate-semialdehyde dehydrogenase